MTCPSEPGPAISAAADHHAVGAGLVERRRALVDRADVAIGDDRERHRLLHLADEGPVGLPLYIWQRVRPWTVIILMPEILGDPREFAAR